MRDEPAFPGGDRYVVEDRLGAGAMGVVYRAYDRTRGERVALKLLRTVEPGALYRFKQEFRTLADLAHPNLVRLHELVSTGDRWFFTMELLDGVDFLTHVRGASPAVGSDDDEPAPVSAIPHLPGAPITQETVPSPMRARAPTAPPLLRAISADEAERLRGALVQLAAGVVALHDARRLHRDLKPSNVMVTRDGRVVILDFGVATELFTDGRAAAAAEAVGTPAYMAPELGSGAAAGEPCDWYSVGVMLYQALVGRPPFRGPYERVMELKRAVDPQLPSLLAPGVPEDLEALCLALLAREPAARPGGPVVLARLGGWAMRAAPPPTRAPTLIGRDRELAQLRAALVRADAGPAVVRVHGSSGMGKSALVGQFLAVERAAGATIALLGRCYERESVPYKALDSLIDALARHLLELPVADALQLLPAGMHALARLFPVLRRLEVALDIPWLELPANDPHEIRDRAVGALRALLARLAARAPVVLHIDDVQWGDTDSAELLSDVLRAPDAPPVLLIVSTRSEDAAASPFLAALSPDPERTLEIALPRLAHDDARALTETLLGAGMSTDAADAIARESGGSPFFIKQLVTYAATHEGKSARLGEVLVSRLDGLAAPARRLLDVIAVAAGPVAQGVALAAAALGPDGRAALDQLRDRHLVRTRGARDRDAVETYHDRIRETAFSLLGAERRVELHVRLARALMAEERQDAEAVAFHLERAGEHERAAEHYLRAANHAAHTLAFASAVGHYRHALELRPLAGRAESEVLARLADAVTSAGHGSDAVAIYRRAAIGAERSESLRLRRRAVEELLRAARIDEGLAALRELLPELGKRLPRRVLPQLILARGRVRARRIGRGDAGGLAGPDAHTRMELYWSAAAALGLSDHLTGALFQAWHYLESSRHADPVHMPRAYGLEAIFTALRGFPHRARAERLLARAHQLAPASHDLLTEAIVLASSALSHYQFCEWSRTHDECASAARILRDALSGAWWHINCLDMYWLWSGCYLGRIRTCGRAVAELTRAAEARGDRFGVTMLATGLPNVVWLARDDLDGARRAEAEAMRGWPRERYLLQHYWELQSSTQNDLYAGDALAAWQRVSTQWPRLRGAHVLRIEFARVETVWMRARCALAAAAAGHQRERLLRVAERDVGALYADDTPLARTVAALTAAGAAALRGQTPGVVRQLEQAVAAADRAGMTMHGAAARRRLGQLLGGDEGQAHLAASNAWMSENEVVDPERLAEMLAPAIRA